MKLVKFRIKNYKSIVDSGECYFSPGMTILAGKNECGKSSILEALRDFSPERELDPSVIPISELESYSKPEIVLGFTLTLEEWKEVQSSVEFALPEESEVLVLSKSFSRVLEISTYQLDIDSLETLGFAPRKARELARELEKTIGDVNSELISDTLPVFYSFQDLSEYSLKISEFLEKNQDNAEVDSYVSMLSEIIERIGEVEENRARAQLLIDLLKDRIIPNFVLFSSFDDQFPNEVLLSDLASNSWCSSLEGISDFSIAKISAENNQHRQMHERQVNVEFKETFRKYWTQDEISLEIRRDGDHVHFWILENNVNYHPSQRSQGQRWYLSFYVKIVSRITNDRSTVVLIDEPGLYLHAKAQKDLLSVLRDHSSEFPIIFSTHSPYLIEYDDLESLRLVEKLDNQSGTKILGKIHKHETASKETLTPIVTAIGLGLNDAIQNVTHIKNVVVEGPSDVYYLQAFKLLWPDVTDKNFINGGGSTQMGLVGTILEGWGGEVSYLFDNDQGKHQGVEMLKNWRVLDEQVNVVTESRGDAIEDIFTNQDFQKYVLDNESLTYKISNSSYVKQRKKDKVLLSRQFLQKVKNPDIEVDLEEETRSKIQLLMAKL